MAEGGACLVCAQRLKLAAVLATAATLLYAVSLPNTDDLLVATSQRLTELETLSNTMMRLRRDTLLLKANLSAEGALDIDLDYIPYTTAEMKGYKLAPLPGNRLSIPPVPHTPLGMQAVRLAQANGWPDAWNARQRPTLFLLGPPKSGATYIAGCWRYAMIGDTERRAYPMARERWPLEFDRHGEPTWGTSVWGGFSIPVDQMWNRTGYRRWDPPKEWYIYTALGANWDSWMGFVQRRRFPPVEEGSRRWVLMDATPTYIMSPTAADGIKRDFAEVGPGQTHLQPKFVVFVRDPLSRGYSHFLLHAARRKKLGMEFTASERMFTRHLSDELAWLRSFPICRLMLDDPEGLLGDVMKVRAALSNCMFQPDPLQAKPSFLAFGFTALGLRYWLEQFPASRFRAVRSRDLRLQNPSGLMTMLEDLFDMKRLKPRCKKPGERTNAECTGQLQYDHAELFCSKDSPALAVQAWTTEAASLNYTKGHVDELLSFKRIADRWESLLYMLLDAYNIRIWEPPKTTAALKEG